ncbi:MAG TPA: CvpA family protein [Acetobacteraceae bacterium]|nr:CvpA family protein [Acetobacteraceae bacterium]
MTSSANWVDAVLLAVLLVSAIIAFFRGFVREVLAIGAWAGAIVAGFLEYEAGWVRAMIQPHVESETVARLLGAAAVGVVVLIVLMVIIHWVANRVQDSVLGGLDRTLGILFGLARGAFLVVLAYILAAVFLPPVERWPEPVQQARSLPLVADGADWLIAQLPQGMRPRLPEAPGGTPPSRDEFARPPPARNRT